MSRAAHLIIRGRVQGVGYRDWTVRKARELGLSGWVRNRLDGSVEAVISGHQYAAAEDGPQIVEVVHILSSFRCQAMA